MNLWDALPAYIANFLGHSATHSIWEAHLSHAPVHAMQPHWQVLEKGEDDKSTVCGLQSITLHTALSEAGSRKSMAGRMAAMPAGSRCQASPRQ